MKWSKVVPSRAELDGQLWRGCRRPLVYVACLLVVGAVGIAALWWLMDHWRLVANVSTELSWWWTRALGPAERATVAYGLGAVALSVLILAFVIRWGVLLRWYPVLTRRDPMVHASARPEVVGRCHGMRAWREPAGLEGVRLYYKSPGCGLWMWLYVDLVGPDAVSVRGLGVRQLTGGRLIRDRDGWPEARVFAASYAPGHELDLEYTVESETRDRDRKQALAIAGAAMNPEIARRKHEKEPLMVPAAARMMRELRERRRGGMNGAGGDSTADVLQGVRGRV